MAYRGGAVQANSANATSCVVTVSGIGGSGPQNGDIVLACVGASGGTTTIADSADSFSAISGLTNNISVASSQGGTIYYIFSKVAGASEPATYTFTSTGSLLLTASVRVYSGRSATPFTLAPITTGPIANATAPITLAITGFTSGANAGDDVVMFIPNQQLDSAADVPSATPTSGFGNARTDYGTGVQYSPVINSWDATGVSAGFASGTLAGTITDTVFSSIGYAGYLISLAAAAVLTPPYTPFRRTQFFVTDTIVLM